MRVLFVNTSYWTALFNERDHRHARAVELSRSLGTVLLVTTDEILAEFLTFFSGYGPVTRRVAATFVRELLESADVEVVPQSRESFLSALDLYEERLDKAYSLADCASLITMRGRGLHEALTQDHHFTQEGFAALLRD